MHSAHYFDASFRLRSFYIEIWKAAENAKLTRKCNSATYQIPTIHWKPGTEKNQTLQIGLSDKNSSMRPVLRRSLFLWSETNKKKFTKGAYRPAVKKKVLKLQSRCSVAFRNGSTQYGCLRRWFPISISQVWNHCSANIACQVGVTGKHKQLNLLFVGQEMKQSPSRVA